jgi:hypothetical protein
MQPGTSNAGHRVHGRSDVFTCAVEVSLELISGRWHVKQLFVVAPERHPRSPVTYRKWNAIRAPPPPSTLIMAASSLGHSAFSDSELNRGGVRVSNGV